MFAIAYQIKHFWCTGDGRILCRDGKDNPPLVYESEMEANLDGLISTQDLCDMARKREEKLLKLRTKDFLAGKGPHPATMDLP